VYQKRTEITNFVKKRHKENKDWETNMKKPTGVLVLSREMSNNFNNIFNFGGASFFVSPARHVEAQDMSGT
jgi:hypothetical protein